LLSKNFQFYKTHPVSFCCVLLLLYVFIFSTHTHIYIHTYIHIYTEMLWATRETHKLVRRAVLREVTILSSLSHPNIVQFLGCSLNVPATKSRERVRSSMRRRKRRGDSSTHIRQESEYEDAEEVWVVTELLKGRSLYEMIHQSRKTKLTLHYVLRLATDIAKGMVFLHSRNVTHCDLKSSNILLSAGSMNCKIIDFGESLVAGALSSEEDSHRGRDSLLLLLLL